MLFYESAIDAEAEAGSSSGRRKKLHPTGKQAPPPPRLPRPSCSANSLLDSARNVTASDGDIPPPSYATAMKQEREEILRAEVEAEAKAKAKPHAAKQVKVAIPDGAPPGTTLNLTLSNGGKFMVVVPEGMSAGEILTVHIPHKR